MKLIRNICRILVGLVFIYSGFVKGIDPLGSDYKFTDYFNAFGMSWMGFSTLFLSFLLSMFEFLIGVCLFLIVKIKTAAWSTLLFMSFFTLLTLILAIKNPVSDCGCFGDALTLSNWETFWKNIILLILTLVIFYSKEKYKSVFNFIEQTGILLVSLLFMFCLQWHSYRHLPIIDFRPYAIGKNIPTEMSIPEGASHDKYEITLKYKNKQTGEIKKFTEENYPWQDTAQWEYVSTDQKLIQEGYKAPIHDFVIEHPEWGDITQEILEDNGDTFLVLAYDIRKTRPDEQDKLNELAAYAQDKGYRFYGLSASSPEDIRRYTEQYPVNYEFCSTDEVQLKTMIRSNPGLILLRQGTVLDKWAGRDIPEVEEIQHKDLTAYCLEKQQKITDKYVVYCLILFYLSCLFLYMVKKYKRMVK